MLAFLLSAVALGLRLRGRRRPTVWLLGSAAALVYLGATSPVSDALLGPLERQYPPLHQERLALPIHYVVVLGSGYAPRDDVPVTAALDEEALVRIVEGVRLLRRLGTARLIVSGGAPPGRTGSALGYARLARDLGVRDESLVVLSDPLDTNTEAHAIVTVLGASPFILVTSASHMPRAVRLIERAGGHPIAAPTGQQVLRMTADSWRGLLPTAFSLHKTERALHEYLGLAALNMGAP